jgi:hypothetical protein
VPAGAGPLRRRLALEGRFSLDRGLFRDDETQSKLVELSRRSQGRRADDESASDRVVTHVSGAFALKRGILALDRLAFAVPGATVALAGTYDLSSTAVNLEGTLRMQTTVSRAVGGFKSIFLKPFDWIFRRDGVGAVLPIQVEGSREHLRMGIRLSKALTGGE